MSRPLQRPPRHLRNPARRAESVEIVRLAGHRKLRARIWSGHGETIVLLHGVLSSATTWRPFVCETPRPCVAFDLPGFGASSPIVEPRIACFADDVIAGLEILGIERYTLVGHSFGGLVAVSVASRSDAVNALILLAPSGHGRRRALSASEPAGMVLTTAITPLLACVSAFLARPTAAEQPRRVERSRVIGRELRHAAAAGVGGTRTAMRAQRRETITREVLAACSTNFEGPIAIFCGQYDRVVDASHSRAVRVALPGSRLEIVSDIGHKLHRAPPEAIVRLLR